jgi:hypothetical protein
MLVASRFELVSAAACLALSIGCGSTTAEVAGDDAMVSLADARLDATEAGQCDGGASASTSVGCSYSFSGLNESASVAATSTVAWSCTSTERKVTGNGLPDHAVGVFPNPDCPNTIRAQTVAASMPLVPISTGKASRIGIVGYAFNGVKFDPSTAGTCSVGGSGTTCSLIGNTGTWNIEALGQSSFDFGTDDNNAHVQPDGAYHYHGMPEGILEKLAKGKAMTLVGFALDGFPVYARYGYSDPEDQGSPVEVVTASYRLKEKADSGRPSTATYPMGAFTQDYEYAAGSGDLDECNGRTGVTPEFPCGTYHYYITDTYPFIQRCVKGTPIGGGTMPPPDGGASCGTCDPGRVCCPSGQPCAGMCVPDCRAGGACPDGLTCDSASGVCKP